MLVIIFYVMLKSSSSQEPLAFCPVASSRPVEGQSSSSNMSSLSSSRCFVAPTFGFAQIEATNLLNVNRLVFVIGLLVVLVAQMPFLFRKWCASVWFVPSPVRDCWAQLAMLRLNRV